MSLFRFDFLADEPTLPHEQKKEPTMKSPTMTEGRKIPLKKFVFCDDPCWLERANQAAALDYDILQFGEHHLGIVPLKKCRNLQGKFHDSFQGAESQRTDIVPGIYEGGLKVWECSIDLCNFLVKHSDLLMPKFCLELGCGQALPACLILREAAKNNISSVVLVTDYNDFVINGVTASNIVLNSRADDGTFPTSFISKHAILGHGDWMDMSRQLLESNHGISSLPPDGRFDLILAAETTYTAESARDTAILLAKHLVPVTGVGLVATKRYYFGVGGGSDAFREASRKERTIIDGIEYMLQIENVQDFEDGTSNIRDLLKVLLRPTSIIQTIDH